MSRIVVGVIGHVDHGKTALVKALTGQETDRLPEEKARGISIALGFAHLAGSEGRLVDLIDMPGHERFVRTMISGATGIDAALLVVAANEGVMPQTREHVEIAGLLGIGRALVAVTKCDLVSPEEAEIIGADAADLLERCYITPLPHPIITSTIEGQGIEALRRGLLELTSQPLHRADGIAFLPIDRAFTIPGHGPVVTGTLRGAAVAVGGRLELLAARLPVRVRALQVHGESAVAAQPGQRVALNLRGVELGELARGMALAVPDVLEASEWLTLHIRALPGAPVLTNGARVRALFGTTEAGARLRLLDCDKLEPGDNAFAQLRLDHDTAIPAGEHVVLRRASPATTLAGGKVLEPLARRHKRRHGPTLEWLELLRTAPVEQVVGAAVARAGAGGTSLNRLAQLTNLMPTRIAELLGDCAVTVSRGGDVRPITERRPVLASKPDPGREAQIAEALRLAGLTPPLPKDLVTDAAAHRAVERLLKQGVLLRCTDRDKGKELLFHRDAVAEAQRILAPMLAGSEGLSVSEIAAALGVSRKFVMPLLDHLDRVRFTRRAGGWRFVH